MTINSRDAYIASAKQRITMTKTAARTTVATGWFSLFDVAGSPGAGTLAGVNATAGVVPDDTVGGYPPINSFAVGATGYIGRVAFDSNVACKLAIYDRIWVSGAHAFNAAQSLTGQPSYASRLPDTDYKNLEIWVEQVTAATGNQAVAVTYTNQSGTTGRSTGAVGIGAAPTVGRCWQLPLQAGDSGVQQITNIAGSVASVGTFNVMILRPLWNGRIQIANGGDVHNMFSVGLPVVYDTTALYMLVSADSTSSGIPSIDIDIVNG